jgi:hypothetical protein
MTLRRGILLLILSLLVFGMAGGVSMVAAATSDFNPGFITDPDFFSPSWKPAKITWSFSDPDFFNSDWSGKTLYKPVADPDFNLASWKVPTIKPAADPDFLYSNWSVKAPVLFRYSGVDTSRINNYNLDPFATDTELRAQGWIIEGDFWGPWN